MSIIHSLPINAFDLGRLLGVFESYSSTCDYNGTLQCPPDLLGYMSTMVSWIRSEYDNSQDLFFRQGIVMSKKCELRTRYMYQFV